MAAWTDFAENKITDAVFRGQALGAPATWYVALCTTAPTDTAAGTEVSGGGYARASIVASLANFAGTQSAGSTTASTGTSATTSNNGVVTFPAPTGNWGVVTHFELWDSATGGNRWVWGSLGTAKTVNNGDPAPTVAAGAMTITMDDGGGGAAPSRARHRQG